MELTQSKAIITVLGKDRRGVIARVATLLADYNINILDIKQTIIGEYFNMIMIVDIAEAKVELSALKEALEVLGREIAMEITCQHEDIFQFMHRI